MIGAKARRQALIKNAVKAKEDVWILNWQNAYEDGKLVEENLKRELAETRDALAKMTIERNRLFEQCKKLKGVLNGKEKHDHAER